MLEYDWLIAMVLGAVFVILGIASIYWGKAEEKDYYKALATRRDVREFVEHLPFRPEPEALKIGGRIAIAVGLLVIAIGIILLLLG